MKVRKEGAESNVAWERGETHTHTLKECSVVKGHFRKLYFFDLCS